LKNKKKKKKIKKKNKIFFNRYKKGVFSNAKTIFKIKPSKNQKKKIKKKKKKKT